MKRWLFGLLSALLIGGRRYAVEFLHRGRRSYGCKSFWTYAEAERWFEEVRPVYPHLWIVDTWADDPNHLLKGLRLLECDQRETFPLPHWQTAPAAAPVPAQAPAEVERNEPCPAS